MILTSYLKIFYNNNSNEYEYNSHSLKEKYFYFVNQFIAHYFFLSLSLCATHAHMPQLQHAAYNFDAKQMQIWNAHLTGSMRAFPTAWLKLWGTCPARIITIELTKPVKRPSPSSSSSSAATAMLPSMTQAEKLPLLLLQFDMHVPSCHHAPAVPLASLTATENTADSARSRGIRTKAHTTKHARSQWERNRGREEGRGEGVTYWNWMTDQMTDGLTACQPEQLKQNGIARKMPSQYSPSPFTITFVFVFTFVLYSFRFILKCSWCRAFYSRSYVFIWITLFSFRMCVCW